MTSVNTKTDDILIELNRIHDSKNSGSLTSGELAVEIKNISDVYSSQIMQGKHTEEEADELYETYLEQFSGKNANNYFSFNHENLDQAASMFRESTNAAILNKENGRSYLR